jgi:hypothetical protein
MSDNRWQLSSVSERTWRIVAVIVVAVLIILFALFGAARATDGPQAVFWGAIENSMRARALTVSSTASASGTKEQVLSQLDFGQHPLARTFTKLSASGSVAETETLTTPNAQYIRYDYIHKLVHGKPANFANVLDVWAKSASYSGNTVPPAFSQTLLDDLLPFPMGQLTSAERTRLLNQIQDGQIYTVNFAKTKKTTYNGRPVFVYKVSIEPVLYLQLIKNYAPDVDMHQLDQLDPNEYGGEAAVQATWTIDAYSKELVKADDGTGKTQIYSGWDVPISEPVPQHAISASELQKRLGAVL